MEIELNGNAVFAATGGKPFDAGLPTMVFIHGASFDRTVWKMQTRYFAWHGFGVLALDMPAHGRSGGEPLRSITEMAAWLDDLFDALEVSQASIVGHSGGALIALEAAARHPDRIRAISLVGMAYPMPVGDPLLVPAAANERVAKERLVAWSYGRAAGMGGDQVPGMWMTGGGMRIVEQTRDNVLHADLAACNDYTGGEAAADLVSCPVQFILGEMDMMTPVRQAQKFAARFKDPDMVLLPGAGHNLMIERPDATLDALKRFHARS